MSKHEMCHSLSCPITLLGQISGRVDQPMSPEKSAAAFAAVGVEIYDCPQKCLWEQNSVARSEVMSCPIGAHEV
jgi:hypothetical protein